MDFKALLAVADLLQDVKAGQLTEVDPVARLGFLSCYREHAQVEGGARDCRGAVELSDNGLDYHAVDHPVVAGFGPNDTRRRAVTDCSLRALFKDKLRMIRIFKLSSSCCRETTRDGCRCPT